jgi:hypothetical protein
MTGSLLNSDSQLPASRVCFHLCPFDFSSVATGISSSLLRALRFLAAILISPEESDG